MLCDSTVPLCSGLSCSILRVVLLKACFKRFIVSLGTNGCLNSCVNSPEDGAVSPKHVEIRQYINKIEIVTSVGFYSIFIISVRPSASLSGTTRLPLTDVHEILYFSSFRKKKIEKIQVLIKSDKNQGHLHEDQYTFCIISRSVLLKMQNVSHRNCRENRNTYFVFNNFFSKIVPFMRSCGKKHCRAKQVSGANMVHAHCMLDTLGYRHTLRICNNYCFLAATMVARTRLNVTRYAHCLSC
jgi:hypothetical protein